MAPAADPRMSTAPAPASLDAPTEATVHPDPTLDRYRTSVEALTERMIGSASRAVRFDWRQSSVGVGAFLGELLERNNFGSLAAGVMFRHPFGDFMGEAGLTRVFTWSTDSSDKLALTPYRQYGRPSRFELDLNLGYPLAEGVVTPRWSWIPAAEMVFSVQLGFRYSIYPEGFSGLSFGDVAKSLLAPRLTDAELNNLETIRPEGMVIDSARYGLLGGFSLDLYLRPGFFLSPRTMIAIPLLNSATGSNLGWWWEISTTAGWMF